MLSTTPVIVLFCETEEYYYCFAKGFHLCCNNYKTEHIAVLFFPRKKFLSPGGLSRIQNSMVAVEAPGQGYQNTPRIVEYDVT